MRTIIAGSRDILGPVGASGAPWIVEQAVEASGFEITVVISGTARGVDRMGEKWAKVHGIPVEKYPADWKSYGRRAGPERNRRMASAADALIAIWDGRSRGTAHMIDAARVRGLKVFVLTP